ncbi:unnamed protein product [Rodentolepis nana]|uniref:Protein FRA10AC1 n=1 Tax=Rodentolepis nana TaxID=102285 RepID=A0A0R3TK11_RODNA|nr:unnamed protein product [Rodentolepis nana]
MNSLSILNLIFFKYFTYQRHQKMVNDYLQYYGGSIKHFKRDTWVVLKLYFRFVWEEKDNPETWEEKLAKHYWDRLYKEYAVADLSRYKEKKLGLRWRSEKEVISGKGQFKCGAVDCNSVEFLRSWEVDFAYRERGLKRNVLVKVRLCPMCSAKLNYHKRHSEFLSQPQIRKEESDSKAGKKAEEPDKPPKQAAGSEVWKESSSVQKDDSSRRTLEDEFDDYLRSMFM